MKKNKKKPTVSLTRLRFLREHWLAANRPAKGHPYLEAICLMQLTPTMDQHITEVNSEPFQYAFQLEIAS